MFKKWERDINRRRPHVPLAKCFFACVCSGPGVCMSARKNSSVIASSYTSRRVAHIQIVELSRDPVLIWSLKKDNKLVSARWGCFATKLRYLWSWRILRRCQFVPRTTKIQGRGSCGLRRPHDQRRQLRGMVHKDKDLLVCTWSLGSCGRWQEGRPDKWRSSP